jgi:hypothetical protein
MEVDGTCILVGIVVPTYEKKVILTISGTVCIIRVFFQKFRTS